MHQTSSDTRRWPIALVLLLAVGLAGCGPRAENSSPANDSETSVDDSDATRANGSAQAGKTAAPKVRIETSMGTIVVRLHPKKAQLTVDNFLRYVDEGYYDGTVFHEIHADGVVIGGIHDKDLEAKASRVSVRNEAHNGLKNVRGTVAMARDPRTIDSATSGFFINLADNPHLDHEDETPEGYGYCVFGEVTEGMDVADRIGKVKTHDTEDKDGVSFQRVPVEPVLIRSIRVVR